MLLFQHVLATVLLSAKGWKATRGQRPGGFFRWIVLALLMFVAPFAFSPHPLAHVYIGFLLCTLWLLTQRVAWDLPLFAKIQRSAEGLGWYLFIGQSAFLCSFHTIALFLGTPQAGGVAFVVCVVCLAVALVAHAYRALHLFLPRTIDRLTRAGKESMSAHERLAFAKRYPTADQRNNRGGR